MEHYIFKGTYSDGMACVQNEEMLYGYVDTNDNEIIPCHYILAKDFNEGMAAVAVNYDNTNVVWGYVDTSGKEVIKCKYWNASHFSCGLARIMEDDIHYGYIDTKGNNITGNIFKDAGNYKYDMAKVQLDNSKYGYLGKDGQYAVLPIYDNLSNINKKHNIMISINDAYFGNITTENFIMDL